MTMSQAPSSSTPALVQGELFDFADISSLPGKRLMSASPWDYDLTSRGVATEGLLSKQVVVTATLYMIFRNKIFLILHHKTGKINGVGGKVDTHEHSLVDTLIHEVGDEVSIHLSDPGFGKLFLFKQSISPVNMKGYGDLIQDNCFAVFTDHEYPCVVPPQEASKITPLGWKTLPEVRSTLDRTFTTNAYRLNTLIDHIEKGLPETKIADMHRPRLWVFDLDGQGQSDWRQAPPSVDLGVQFARLGV